MNLLGGQEIGEDEGRECRKNLCSTLSSDRREQEKALDEKEIKDTVTRMKLKKAAGCDRIPMEAQIYSSEAVQRGLTEMIMKIQKKGRIPKEWKNIIVTYHYYALRTKYMQKL